MKTLQEWITFARDNKKAVPHFNVSTLDFFWAAVNGTRKVSEETGQEIPVVIGMSEGERDFMGQIELINLVKDYRNRTGYPVFVNADHTYSVARACEAIDAGFDMVIIDAAEKNFEENSAMAKEVVTYKNTVRPDCLIEAELGFIGAGSNIKDTVPAGVSEETMTSPSEAVRYIAETGIDLLAPSVGNVHGLIKSGKPRLHPLRVSEIASALPEVPLVLHGGSGSTDEDFLAVINSGISMVHISTELRFAFHQALQKSLADTPDEIGPAKYLTPVRAAVQSLVEDRVRLFWNGN